MFDQLHAKLVSFVWGLKPAKHTFTVDRKRWLRGEDISLCRLKRSRDNKLDALGFYLTSIGLAESEINEVGNPTYLPKDILNKHNLLRSWLFRTPEEVAGALIPTDDCMDIIRLNDKREISDVKVTDAYRESLLKPLFAKHGIKVRFSGSITPS